MVPRARDRRALARRRADAEVRCSRILSTPKAFNGLFAVIQRNAIESWTRLEPRPEIILFGRDAGTAELCDELGLRHVPDVAHDRPRDAAAQRHVHHGQALASEPGRLLGECRHHPHADDHAGGPIVTDHSRRAYLVGRRTDLDQLTPLDFSEAWAAVRSRRGRQRGRTSSRRTGSTTSCSRGASSRTSRRSRSDGRLRPLVDLAGRPISAPTSSTPPTTSSRSTNGTTTRTSAAVPRCSAASRPRERRHRRRLAPLPLDRSRPAQAGLRRSVGARPGSEYRLARPAAVRRAPLRFTRPLRRRLLGEQATRRRTR